MRRSQTLTISDIISSLLKDQGLEEKLCQNRLMNSWEKIMGKTISKYTRSMYIKDRILFVNISSPVVKHEVSMLRDDLVKRLNDQAGKKVIDKIVLR